MSAKFNMKGQKMAKSKSSARGPIRGDNRTRRGLSRTTAQRKGDKKRRKK